MFVVQYFKSCIIANITVFTVNEFVEIIMIQWRGASKRYETIKKRDKHHRYVH